MSAAAPPIVRTDAERLDFIQADMGKADLRGLVDRKMARAGVPNVATCISCGCNDLLPCLVEGDHGCSWTLVDREAKVGLCSNCPGDESILRLWHAGVRQFTPREDW